MRKILRFSFFSLAALAATSSFGFGHEPHYLCQRVCQHWCGVPGQPVAIQGAPVFSTSFARPNSAILPQSGTVFTQGSALPQSSIVFAQSAPIFTTHQVAAQSAPVFQLISGGQVQGGQVQPQSGQLGSNTAEAQSAVLAGILAPIAINLGKEFIKEVISSFLEDRDPTGRRTNIKPIPLDPNSISDLNKVLTNIDERLKRLEGGTRNEGAGGGGLLKNLLRPALPQSGTVQDSLPKVTAFNGPNEAGAMPSALELELWANNQFLAAKDPAEKAKFKADFNSLSNEYKKNLADWSKNQLDRIDALDKRFK